MAQASDSTVDNGTGAAVRSDINARFAALFSNHSGSTDTAMVTKTAYQTWADNSSAQALKLRTAANAWTPLRGLVDGAVLGETELKFRVDGTQRMSIGKLLVENDGGASILIKTTVNPFKSTDTSTEGAQFTDRGRLNIGINQGHSIGLNRWSTAGAYMVFAFDGGQLGGSSISTDGSVIAFNAGSDYRLKENIVTLSGSDAKTKVNQFKVKRFNFKNNPSKTVDGFIAHEAQTVVPEAVTGHKDEVDSNGDPVYQGIDQSKIVPLLTAALQEAFAEITALTSRVEALEAS
jgi:hypothetical protein|tara:strand:- start:194 stop:1066 length:873 start_codon:yes stop_codon:yes gene_type:complete